MKTKLCHSCKKEFSVLYRVKVDSSKTGIFFVRNVQKSILMETNFMFMVALGKVDCFKTRKY